MCLCSSGRFQVPGRGWQNHEPAAKRRQCGVSVPHGTAYVVVQHLLFIVETQTHKRVTSAVKVNELRVNMEIFQNIGDGAEFAATSHPQVEEITHFRPANNMQPLPIIYQNMNSQTVLICPHFCQGQNCNHINYK